MGWNRFSWALCIQTSIHDQCIIVIFEYNHEIKGDCDNYQSEYPEDYSDCSPATEAVFEILPLNSSWW